MEEKYDTALLGILQHEGKIERFLDVIFGFLFRRLIVIDNHKFKLLKKLARSAALLALDLLANLHSDTLCDLAPLP